MIVVIYYSATSKVIWSGMIQDLKEDLLRKTISSLYDSDCPNIYSASVFKGTREDLEMGRQSSEGLSYYLEENCEELYAGDYITPEGVAA